MLAAPADFWSVVGQTELTMYASLFSGTLEESLESLAKEFKDHYGRVNAPKRWATIYDNATFVLSKYKQRATPREAAAAGQLLNLLEDLAGRVQKSSMKESTREAEKASRSRRTSSSSRPQPSKRG